MCKANLNGENLKTLFVGRAGVCFFSSLYYSAVYIACFYAYLYSQVSKWVFLELHPSFLRF